MTGTGEAPGRDRARPRFALALPGPELLRSDRAEQRRLERYDALHRYSEAVQDADRRDACRGRLEAALRLLGDAEPTALMSSIPGPRHHRVRASAHV